MKLFEAMKVVWESDIEWFTKKNALQAFALVGCAMVSLWPWIPLGYFLVFSPLAGDFPLLFFPCMILGSIWTLYWLRVFSRWWPF